MNIDKKFTELIEKIFNAQMKYPQDVHFGSIWCLKHGYHIRAAEAVYPLAYFAHQSKRHDYLRSSINLANWLSARQEPYGAWIDLETEKNTTIFQLLALVLAFPLIRDSLGVLDKNGLEESIIKASSWCLRKLKLKHLSSESGISLAIALHLVSDNFGIDVNKKYAMKIVKRISKRLRSMGYSHNQVLGGSFGRSIEMFRFIKTNDKIDREYSEDKNCIMPVVYQAFDEAFSFQFK